VYAANATRAGVSIQVKICPNRTRTPFEVCAPLLLLFFVVAVVGCDVVLVSRAVVGVITRVEAGAGEVPIAPVEVPVDPVGPVVPVPVGA
jgi:hypothetical protein